MVFELPLEFLPVNTMGMEVLTRKNPSSKYCLIFPRQTAIDSKFGLSNEVVCILTAQGAAKLLQVKFESSENCLTTTLADFFNVNWNVRGGGKHIFDLDYEPLVVLKPL